jgi:hypothetical protein
MSRLARVQVAFWGNLFTSGLSQVDYFITSELFHPSGVSPMMPWVDLMLVFVDDSFVEQLVQFETLSTFYKFPELSKHPTFLQQLGDKADQAALRQKLQFSAEDHLYICPHNLNKFGVTPFDDVIVRVFKADAK